MRSMDIVSSLYEVSSTYKGDRYLSELLYLLSEYMTSEYFNHNSVNNK